MHEKKLDTTPLTLDDQHESDALDKLDKKFSVTTNEQGFTKFEMIAKLTSFKLYKILGYISCGTKDHQLPNGFILKFIHMIKNIKH